MSERLRQMSADALHVARVLGARGYTVHYRVRNAVHEVCVQGRHDGPKWFDAGTLDAALLQVDLTKFPAVAA